MEEIILDFIRRRFSIDCNWLSGNCYYFAIILKTRFPDGIIYYDLVQGHFIFKYEEKFYDWSGKIQPIINDLVDWESYWKTDYKHFSRIVRDVIM